MQPVSDCIELYSMHAIAKSTIQCFGLFAIGKLPHVEIICLQTSIFVVFMFIEGEKNSSVTDLVLFGTKNSAVDFFATVQVALWD